MIHIIASITTIIGLIGWTACAGYNVQLTIIGVWRILMRNVYITPRHHPDRILGSLAMGLYCAMIINIRLLMGPIWTIHAWHTYTQWRKTHQDQADHPWIPMLETLPYMRFSEDISL